MWWRWRVVKVAVFGAIFGGHVQGWVAMGPNHHQQRRNPSSRRRAFQEQRQKAAPLAGSSSQFEPLLSLDELASTQYLDVRSRNRGRGRAAKRSLERKAEERYGSTVRRLLELERSEEERMAEERIKLWPVERLAASGLALHGLRARTRRHTFFGKKVARLELRRGGDENGVVHKLPFHRFGPGDLVVLSQKEQDSSSRKKIEGAIVETSEKHVDVAVTQGAPIGSGWRLDQYYSGVSYERMEAAVDAVTAATSGYFEARKRALEKHRDEMAVELRRVVVYSAAKANSQDWLSLALSPAAGLCRKAPSYPSVRGAVAEFGALLDASQRDAATKALRSRVGLIQGPPGTGKTRVAACVLKAALNMRDHEVGKGIGGTLPKHAVDAVKKRALACAPSNVAADNLLERLVALNVNAVRVGNPASVRPSLRHATLDAKVDRWLNHGESPDSFFDPDRDVAVLSVENDDDDQSSGSPSPGASSQKKQRSGQKKKDRAAAALAVLKDADVVVASCVGAGGDLLAPFLAQGASSTAARGPKTKSGFGSEENRNLRGLLDTPDLKFGLVVIDEAAQATEPQCLVPLAAALGASQLVLVGDPMQLPPVVVSLESRRGGLGVSLFARLQTAGLSPRVLTRQYRMHPAINAFSSRRFYRSKVTTCPLVADDRRSTPPPKVLDFAWGPDKLPVAFIAVDGQDRLDHLGTGKNTKGKKDTSSSSSSSSGASSSFVNDAEVAAVAAVVKALLEPGCATTPTVDIDDIGVVTPYAAQARAIARAVEFADVEVDTVDGYQGREKEIMLVSAVRANPDADVGFLADFRRLNVALTRPRRALLVFGHPDTLQADPNWRAFLHYCQRLDSVRPFRLKDLHASSP